MLLKLAQRLHRLTDGIFDPCLPTHAGRLQDLEISSKEPLRDLSRTRATGPGRDRQRTRH